MGLNCLVGVFFRVKRKRRSHFYHIIINKMLKLTIHLGLFDHLKCDTAIKQIIKIRHITQKEIRRDML